MLLLQCDWTLLKIWTMCHHGGIGTTIGDGIIGMIRG